MLTPSHVALRDKVGKKLQAQTHIQDEIERASPEARELLAKVAKHTPGECYLERDLGLADYDYVKRLNPIYRWLEIMGYKVEHSHSSNFYNERMFIKIDKDWVNDMITYNALAPL
uniref:Uncharacterized protein n=1 Tax=Pseudomonas phage Cygsa01 TaxID=3138529 RepID=A0AAU6W3D5_9VIRU